MGKQIKSGTVKDIHERKGEWLFIDLGYKEKGESTGVLHIMGRSGKVKICEVLTFGDAVRRTQEVAQQVVCPPLNLVIEAPLSVTFNRDNNPTGRACDVKGSQRRYWYIQPAPPLIFFAGYLLKELKEWVNFHGQCEVRLFEGFVSFKEQGSKSDHLEDVKALRDAVWDPKQCQIFVPERLKRRESDYCESAFGFMGMDFGIPPVIRT